MSRWQVASQLREASPSRERWNNSDEGESSRQTLGRSQVPRSSQPSRPAAEATFPSVNNFQNPASLLESFQPSGSIPPRRLRLLSLDGGGVRGLSALLILEQLMHSINHTDPPKPCDHFDLMGGTSTGGLIAIMLGRLRMSVKDCIDAYTTLMDNIFVKQRHRVKIGKDKKLTEPNTWVDVQGKFDDEVLEEAVRTILKKFGYKEDELLKDASPSGCKVFVCATSANRGKPVILSSYFSPNHSIHLLSATTILKAARATSAATSFFNPANISGEIFVDGGLGANNPVNHVFAEAQEVWPELDIRNHLACLISVGTGLTPLTSFDPTDPLGIKDGLVAIATETNETHEKFCKSNQDLQKDPKRFFRFNATGLEDIKMDQPERKEDIQYATYDYFTKGSFSADIRACKKALEPDSWSIARDQRMAGPESVSFERPQFAWNIKVIERIEKSTPNPSSSPTQISDPRPSEVPFSSSSVKRTRDYKKRLVNSLRFTEIDNRYSNIYPAHHDTCQWLLSNAKYLDWLDPTKLSEHNGLLWLEGNPGSGKSTLMKFALTEAQKSWKDAILIYFFFHARGSDLEKEVIGMYRSLLLQIFTKAEDTQDVFDDIQLLTLPGKRKYRFQIPQLQDLLKRAIQKLGQRRLAIFVDALDECVEAQARRMVGFFERLGEPAVNSRTRPLVFFASRPYPNITTGQSVRLILHEEIGHSDDIARYILSELKATKNEALEWIRSEILARASGIFIWVVFVVEALNEAWDNGEHHALKKTLEDIPVGMNNLLASILSRDGRKIEEMKLCIQWILFAKRPLRTQELYYAMLSRINPTQLASPWNHEEITLETMELYIRSSSKGLAQVTKSTPPTVQFIHESVRDFLLSNDGMESFWHSSEVSSRGSSNEELKQCCVNCIASIYSISLADPAPTNSPGPETLRNTTSQRCITLKRKRNKDIRLESSQEFPFLEYAALNILYHADVACLHDVSQSSFLQQPLVQDLMTILALYEGDESLHESLRSGVPTVESILLFILAEKKLSALVTTWLHINPSIDIVGELPLSPMRAALIHGDPDTIRALLTPDPKEPPSNSQHRLFRPPRDGEIDELIRSYHDYTTYGHRRSAAPSLWLFLENGDQPAALTLLRSNRYHLDTKSSPNLSGSPLSYAAGRGYEEVVRFLLETQLVDIESTDISLQTPLSTAAKNGQDSIVNLLLNTQTVKVNPRSSTGQTPLSYAAESGQRDIVGMLIQAPNIIINSQDNKGRTAFFHAASKGHDSSVILLRDAKDVDINLPDRFGQTPLSFAALNEHESTVKLILDTQKVEFNPQDSKCRTPLFLAAEKGYESIVHHFIARPEVNFDSRDCWGRTPFSYATLNGHEEVARQLFSTNKVNILNRDRWGEMPLDYAAQKGDVKIVKFLLSIQKFDMHATEADYGESVLKAADRSKSVLSRILREYCGCVDCVRQLSNKTHYGFWEAL